MIKLIKNKIRQAWVRLFKKHAQLKLRKECLKYAMDYRATPNFIRDAEECYQYLTTGKLPD